MGSGEQLNLLVGGLKGVILEEWEQGSMEKRNMFGPIGIIVKYEHLFVTY